MYFLEEVSSVLNTLYGLFLGKRLSSAWEADTLPGLKRWMEGKLQEGTERMASERGGQTVPF